MPENTNGDALQTATFAGGCFWCMEAVFDGIEGVTEVASGYTGGRTENPSYKEVCSGTTGHYEAVQVQYNPQLISYEELLDIYWRQIDPTDSDGQFYDRGPSYRTAVFYHNADQREKALASRQVLADSGRFPGPIATEILPAAPFYRAEEDHQHYHERQACHYNWYRRGSGRDAFIQKHWGRQNG